MFAIGSVAYRTNLLDVAGAWAASRVTAIVLRIARGGTVRTTARQRRPGMWLSISAVGAGLAVATAADVWQHSIHANAI